MPLISKWLVEYIKFSYNKHDLPTPDRVKGHKARKMAVTYMYADMAGADLQNICEAICWENTLLSFIGLMPLPTPTQILAGEF